MDPSAIGFIYVMTNPAIVGLVKIGKTHMVPFRPGGFGLKTLLASRTPTPPAQSGAQDRRI